MKLLFKQYHILFLSFTILSASSIFHINAISQGTLFGRIAHSFSKLFHGQFNQMDADDYTRIITTSAVTAGVCYGIYRYFFKEYKKTKPVNLDKTSINYTYKKVLNDNVIVRHMSVAGQQGTTCGYHALKNGILAVNALHGYGAGKLQHNLLDTNLANKLINQWRGYINARRHITNQLDAQRDFLSGEEIYDLFLAENDIALIHVNINFPRTLKVQCRLSTLSEDNLNHLGLLDDIRDNFDKNQGLHSHIFILNSGGHWYTVVLHKAADGKHEYIAMDTGGLDIKNSVGVKRLITCIEGAAVADKI